MTPTTDFVLVRGPRTDEDDNPSFYKAIEKTEEHFGIVNELRMD